MKIENSGWPIIALEEAAEICDNQRKPVNSKERAKRLERKKQGELYPYYGATGQVGYIDEYIIDGEYVLLGEDGAPFLDAFASKAYLISGKGWVNNHAHILKSKMNSKFLCYYLNAFSYKGFVSGTTRLKLTQASMKKIPIPCPLPVEQKRIVNRIEELFSNLDKAVEMLQTTKAQLAVYRQAVLKEAFADHEKWEKYQFNDLMSVIRNGYGAKPDDMGEHRILRISSVRSMKLNLTDYRLNQSEFSREDTIHENDLLLTRYNGSKEFVGVCASVPTLPCAYAYPDKLIKCTPKLQDQMHSKFLQYYLNQGEARKYLQSKVKTTSGQNGISGSDIKKTAVFLPDLTVQKAVVEEIESRLSVCDSIEQTVDTALQQAEVLRQSILKQVFEGKLVK